MSNSNVLGVKPPQQIREVQVPTIENSVLATSEKPLDLCSGVKTLGISVGEVAYDKEFTIMDWKFNFGLGTATFKVAGRFVVGVCGPSYAIYVAPTFTYADEVLQKKTYYNWWAKNPFGWLSRKTTYNPTTVNFQTFFRDDDASRPYFKSIEKSIDRTISIEKDDWRNLEILGGFTAGAWLTFQASAGVDWLWGEDSDWSSGSVTLNLLDALIAVMKVIGIGNTLLNGDPASSSFQKIQAAVLAVKAPTSSTLSNAFFRGSVLDMQVSAQEGLDDEAGVTLDPSMSFGVNMLTFWSDHYNTMLRDPTRAVEAAAFLASWSYLIVFGSTLQTLSTIGLSLFVGPEFVLTFPVNVKVEGLGMNEEIGDVTSYDPVSSSVRYMTRSEGPTMTWETPVDPANPEVTPTSVSLRLNAVPSITLGVQFRAEIDLMGFFSRTFIASMSTDITNLINAIAGGTVPASIRTDFTADTGNTEASNTVVTSTLS